MKAEARFLLLRTSIYLTGLLIIAWVIGLNIWEIKSKTTPLIKTENGNYIAYAERNYDQAELTLEFENEIPENIRVEISKDFSVFSTHRKKGVYSEEELKAKLFKHNPTQHPNGSFLTFKNNIYFLEEGTLRPLESSRILEIFNLNKKNLEEINKNNFFTLPKGDLINTKSIRNNFPENILLKKDNGFYITGSDGYDYIISSNIIPLIEDKKYPIINISSETTVGKCYKSLGNNLEIICYFNLKKQKTKSGNIYFINITSNNQPISNFKTTEIKFRASLTLSEILENIKNMFIK